MKGIMFKYGSDRSKEAFDELLRRHVLPIVEASSGRFSMSFGKKGKKEGVMKALQVASKGQKVPAQLKMQMRQVKRKLKNVSDNELMSRARQGKDMERPINMIERIIKSQKKKKK